MGASKWKGEVGEPVVVIAGMFFSLLKMKKPALRGVRILRVRFFLKNNFNFFLVESYMDVFLTEIWDIDFKKFSTFSWGWIWMDKHV